MTLTYPSSLGTLTERVRRMLATRDEAPDHWSDARLRDALNEAQREVQNQLLLTFEGRYFVKETGNLTPSGNRITLPADFKRLISFDKRLSSGEDWKPVRVLSPAKHYEAQQLVFPRLSSATMPLHEAWSLYPDFLRAHGSANMTGTYRLVYQHKIADLQQDGNLTQIPDDYQDMLVYYAASVAAQQAGASEREDRARLRYEQKLSEMRRTAEGIVGTEFRRIRRVRYARGF